MSDLVAADMLRLFIDRARRLNDEIKGLQLDRKDVYAEAKGQGFDVPTIKRLVREMDKAPELIAEANDLYEVYRAALGSGGDLGDDDTPAAPIRGRAAAIERSRQRKAEQRAARGVGSHARH